MHDEIEIDSTTNSNIEDNKDDIYQIYALINSKSLKLCYDGKILGIKSSLTIFSSFYNTSNII